MPKKIEISHKTIIFTILFLVFLWLIFQIRQILLILFVSLILMSALNPSVKKLEKIKIPRWLSILIIYIVVMTILGVAIGGVIPPLIEQTTTLIEHIPEFFQQFKILGIDEKMLTSQLSTFTAIPANIIKFIFGLFSNIVAILALGVISFYLLMERKNLDQYLAILFGEDKEKEIEKVINKIEDRLGGWVRGQLLLMLIVGLLNYLGFRIIGIDYALPLAILAFFLEIVPNLGPTLAALPAVIIGLTVSPLHALAVAGWCFLVQQLENSILVPRIMKKIAGVNPLISIIFLAIGFKLAGIGGAILAIPTFIVLEVVASEISSSKKFKEI